MQCSLPNKARSFSSSSSCFWNLDTRRSAAIIGRSRCQGTFWAITRVQTSLSLAPHHAPSAGDRTVQQLLMGKTGSQPHSQRALLFKQQSQVHTALVSQENTSFPPRMPAGSLTRGAGGMPHRPQERPKMCQSFCPSFLSEHVSPEASKWGSRRPLAWPTPSGVPRRHPRKCSSYVAFPPCPNQCPSVSSQNSILQHQLFQMRCQRNSSAMLDLAGSLRVPAEQVDHHGAGAGQKEQNSSHTPTTKA